MQFTELLSKQDQKMMTLLKAIVLKGITDKRVLSETMRCSSQTINRLIVQINHTFGDQGWSLEQSVHHVFLKNKADIVNLNKSLAFLMRRSTKFIVLNAMFHCEQTKTNVYTRLFLSKTEYYRQVQQLNKTLSSLGLVIHQKNLIGPLSQQVFLFYELYDLLLTASDNVTEIAVTNDERQWAVACLALVNEPATKIKTGRLGLFLKVLKRFDRDHYEKHRPIPWLSPMNQLMSQLQIAGNLHTADQPIEATEILTVFIISRLVSVDNPVLDQWQAFCERHIKKITQNVNQTMRTLFYRKSGPAEVSKAVLQIITFYYYVPGGIEAYVTDVYQRYPRKLLEETFQAIEQALTTYVLPKSSLSRPSTKIIISLYTDLFLYKLANLNVEITIGIFVKKYSATLVLSYVLDLIHLFTQLGAQVKLLQDWSDGAACDLVVTDKQIVDQENLSTELVEFKGHVTDLDEVPEIVNDIFIDKYLTKLFKM
ncbi:helix-turn-helix domain-containing protein [Furfurilactobacillus curtus]|uniref:Mga helix-turn-helix domain-containing protein n=1 Tax=Furfurilactobacillus curtus TaxID=1746200 RepID=A0ABQ5JLQ4_9LACO